MQIFIGKNGGKLGPFSLEEVKQKLANGEVSAFDLAWHEGMAEWRPLGGLPEFLVVVAPPPMPGVVESSPQTSPLAVVSLVLGVVALPSSLACGLMIVLAVGGVVCGHIARAQIKRANGTLTGSGLALAGLITGYAVLVLYVLIIVAAVVFYSKMNMR